MPSDTHFWPRFVGGPSAGEMIREEHIRQRLATLELGDDGDFTYYRRKMIFNGLTVVVFAPSELGTAEAINELMEQIVHSHPQMEIYLGE